MNPKVEFILKSSLFGRPRQLTLDPDYLEFGDKNLGSSPPTQFLKEEIEGLRFGINWVHGYGFYFGRIYCIDIRNEANQVIRLRLKSYYGVRKRALGEKYVIIANTLFRYYFDDLARHYLRLFENNIPFNILGVNFSSEGVFFDEKIGTIPYGLLATRSYRTYYSLFSKTNPHHYKAFDYIQDWNACVLEGVTAQIIQQIAPCS